MLAQVASILTRLATTLTTAAPHMPPDFRRAAKRDDAPQLDAPSRATIPEKPPGRPGRPALFKTDAARRMRARAHSRNSWRRKRAAAKGLPIPPPVRLRTPETMPRAVMRHAAVAALGLRSTAAALALDTTRTNHEQHLHTFRALSGTTSKRDAKPWFEAHRADPQAYAPSLDRLQWAQESARDATKRARAAGQRKAWQARRRRADAPPA